jgi:hypothetical protein
MRRKYSIILFAFLLGVLFSPSILCERTMITNEDTASISGFINDIEINPIVKAKISLSCGEEHYECYSDENGYYHKEDLPLLFCIWKITVFKIGYKTAYVDMPITQNSKYNFTLTPLNLVEMEEIEIKNKINIKYYRDKIIGNGAVRGHFFILNNEKKAMLTMIFFKYVPPGYAAFDLVCEKITIMVKNPLNEITYKFTLEGEGMLFSNNWIGSTTLLLPDYYDYSIIEILIYGNYE